MTTPALGARLSEGFTVVEPGRVRIANRVRVDFRRQWLYTFGSDPLNRDSNLPDNQNRLSLPRVSVRFPDRPWKGRAKGAMLWAKRKPIC